MYAFCIRFFIRRDGGREESARRALSDRHGGRIFTLYLNCIMHFYTILERTENVLSEHCQSDPAKRKCRRAVIFLRSGDKCRSSAALSLPRFRRTFAISFGASASRRIVAPLPSLPRRFSFLQYFRRFHVHYTFAVPPTCFRCISTVPSPCLCRIVAVFSLYLRSTSAASPRRSARQGRKPNCVLLFEEITVCRFGKITARRRAGGKLSFPSCSV